MNTMQCRKCNRVLSVTRFAAIPPHAKAIKEGTLAVDAATRTTCCFDCQLKGARAKKAASKPETRTVKAARTITASSQRTSAPSKAETFDNMVSFSPEAFALRVLVHRHGDEYNKLIREAKIGMSPS